MAGGRGNKALTHWLEQVERRRGCLKGGKGRVERNGGCSDGTGLRPGISRKRVKGREGKGDGKAFVAGGAQRRGPAGNLEKGALSGHVKSF